MSTSDHIAESEEPAATAPTQEAEAAQAEGAAPAAEEALETAASAGDGAEASDTAAAGEQAAETPEAQEAAAQEAAPQEAAAPAKQKAEGAAVLEGPLVPGLASDFLKLVHLSTKYPEIGPPVAELAFKTGYSDLGQRIIKVGLESDAPGIEHYTVAAKHAKHMRQYDEAMRYCSDAVRTMATSPERYADADDGAKLLHLVRLGFTILMFELKDVNGHPLFLRTLQEELPRLTARMEADPFYHTLRAQVLWYTDKETSEQAWDRAAELGEPEFAFNARGTWYKEAEHDTDKAEWAYRKGLEQVPGSSLLQHNLAQVLLERARRQPEAARRILQEARALVKSALLGDCPRGLRRHIYNTRAELDALQDSLRKNGEKPREPRRERVRPDGERGAEQRVEEEKKERPNYQVGQVHKGRVRSLTAFGAFVALEGGISGLLHKSEMAHEMVMDPAQVVQVGDEIEVKIIEMGEGERGRPRIGLSRRALLPAPERPEPVRAPRDQQRDGRRRDQEGGRRREGQGPREGQQHQGQQGPREGQQHQGPREGQQHQGQQGPREGQQHQGQQGPRGGQQQGQGPREGQRPRDGYGSGGPRRDRDRDRDRPQDRPPEHEARGTIAQQRGGGKAAAAPSKLASLGEMLLAKLKEQQEAKGS